jgi:hypothetical protein
VEQIKIDIDCLADYILALTSQSLDAHCALRFLLDHFVIYSLYTPVCGFSINIVIVSEAIRYFSIRITTQMKEREL